MKEFTFGSLFAGIGGIDLGLERAGMVCKWQVEIDPFCLKVLEKHWPDVRRFEDVKDCGKRNLDPVDLVCGGFPCQDVSFAGKGDGIAEGTRSGLWFEMLRIVRELRPRYALVENVAAILVRGMGIVLGDLAACGYDAEWQVLPAAAFGAPHVRDRCFILAYADNPGFDFERVFEGGIQAERQPRLWQSFGTVEHKVWLENHCGLSGNVDGVPRRVDRLRSLGNAVVPQVAEWIGRRIMEADEKWIS